MAIDLNNTGDMRRAALEVAGLKDSNEAVSIFTEVFTDFCFSRTRAEAYELTLEWFASFGELRRDAPEMASRLWQETLRQGALPYTPAPRANRLYK